MSESNIMTCQKFVHLFQVTLLCLISLKHIVFHQFFTEIALGDVDLHFHWHW